MEKVSEHFQALAGLPKKWAIQGKPLARNA